jgi:hypothetical protein
MDGPTIAFFAMIGPTIAPRAALLVPLLRLIDLLNQIDAVPPDPHTLYIDHAGEVAAAAARAGSRGSHPLVAGPAGPRIAR